MAFNQRFQLPQPSSVQAPQYAGQAQQQGLNSFGTSMDRLSQVIQQRKAQQAQAAGQAAGASAYRAAGMGGGAPLWQPSPRGNPPAGDMRAQYNAARVAANPPTNLAPQGQFPNQGMQIPNQFLPNPYRRY